MAEEIITKLQAFLQEVKTEDYIKIKYEDLTEMLKETINTIQKQQAELEKKDKIIDLLSYAMTHEEIPQKEYCICRDMSCELLGGNKLCKDCLKQYIEKKVEGNKCK